MLNTAHFTLLAGEPEPWDAEIRDARGPGFSLTEMQVDQHQRGRRSAQLVKTMYGWSVRFASGLDNNAILFGSRQTHERGEDCSIETAIRFGIQWANECPDSREFFALTRNLEGVDLGAL